MIDKSYVYLLKSLRNNSLYIGCTDNLIRRIKEHNSGLSQYTKINMPWELVWYAVFFNKQKAFLFEKYLKTSSGKAFTNKRIYPS